MRARTGGAYDDDVGIFLRHLFVDDLETLAELRRDALLVAQTEVLEVEGGGVSLVGTHLGPFAGGGVAVGPLDEVDSLADPLVHLVHGDDVLGLPTHAPAAVGALTADAARQDGQRLHAEVLAELEVLIVAQSAALVVAPGVLQLTTLLAGTDGGLPAVGVPEAVATAVYHAAAGEAHELRVEVGKGLCEVLAQAVTLISVLGHERELVDVDDAHVQREHLQHCMLRVFGWREHSLVFLPVAAAGVDGGFSKELRVAAPSLLRFDEDDAQTRCEGGVLSLQGVCLLELRHAQEHGEVVLCAGLHGDAVEAVVLQTETLPTLIVVVLLHTLGVQTHVGGVVGMQGIVHASLHPTGGVTGTHEAPRGAGSPAVAFDGTEFERAVLQEFGVETSVGSRRDVLEEDADEFITDGLATGGCLHGLLGHDGQECCQQGDSQERKSFHSRCCFAYVCLFQ